MKLIIPILIIFFLANNLQAKTIADFEITKESVTLSLEGEVIQGDRFNIVVPFDNCNSFEELFTFHTVVNNPRIENLKNKEIEVIYKGVAPSKSMREIEEIKLKKSFPVDTEYNVYRDEKNKKDVLDNPDLFRYSFSQAETEHIIDHKYLRKAKIVSIVPFEIDGEFLNQHVVIFSLGSPQYEHNKKLNDSKSISIKLVDYPYENENIFSYYINKVIDFFDEEKDLDFVASQYFDIVQNEWKSPNIMHVMKRQFEVCEELR